jgi:hypothetical protein
MRPKRGESEQMESSAESFKFDDTESEMESPPTPEILQVAIEEGYRLEGRLRSNPDFRRLEAVRRIIAVYAPGAESPVSISPISHPEPASSATRSAPTPRPDPLSTNSASSPPIPSAPEPKPHADPILRRDPSTELPHRVPSPDISHPIPDTPRISPRGWTWTNSQTSRIRAAAADYLRKIGKRAHGGEIYRAIVSEGVKVNGSNPTATVSARMSTSPIFDRTREGYGLREWADASARRNSQVPSRAGQISHPDPADRASSYGPVQDPNPLPKMSSSRPPTPSGRSPGGGRTRANSDSARIRDAAVEYLRETGRRATSGEIYHALLSKGVTVSGKNPVSGVAARLSKGPSRNIFDNTLEGYGLREWSDGNAPPRPR